MTENQQPGPWQHNQPANDSTWSAQPDPANPPYQPGSQYPTGTPYQPTTPYQPAEPYQPAAPYQPPQPDPAYQPGSAYPSGPTYPPTDSDQPGYGQSPGYAQPPTYGQPQGYQQQPQGFEQPQGFPQAQGYQQPTYGQPGSAQPMTTPWQAAPPPRKRKTGLIVGIVVIALVVLCGGAITAVALASSSGKSSNSGTSTTASGQSSGATSPTMPAIPAGDGAALKAHLIPRPSGAKKLTVDGSTNGVFSIDQFIKAAFSGDSTEKGRLEERGFKIAAEEQWLSKGVEVHVQLVQFGDSDGADSYLSGQHGAYVDDPTVTAHYTLSGVTHGYGYEEHALDRVGNRRATLMCRAGSIVVVVFIFTPGSFNRASELAIVQKQSAALPA